jgi:tRNA isopentenyl-2-thiomethyl-A-37 hydroxylase MiaE
MNDKMNEFLHYRALAAKFNTEHTMSKVADNFLESYDGPLGKQICTTLSMPLIEELEHVLSILEISKRRFIELAVVNALEEAKMILEAHGVEDYLSYMALQAGGNDNE